MADRCYVCDVCVPLLDVYATVSSISGMGIDNAVCSRWCIRHRRLHHHLGSLPRLVLQGQYHWRIFCSGIHNVHMCHSAMDGGFCKRASIYNNPPDQYSRTHFSNQHVCDDGEERLASHHPRWTKKKQVVVRQSASFFCLNQSFYQTRKLFKFSTQIQRARVKLCIIYIKYPRARRLMVSC